MSRLNLFDVKALLCHECGVIDVHIESPNIAYPQARITCLAAKAFQNCKIIAFYLSTLNQQNDSGCGHYSWGLQNGCDVT